MTIYELEGKKKGEKVYLVVDNRTRRALDIPAWVYETIKREGIEVKNVK